MPRGREWVALPYREMMLFALAAHLAAARVLNGEPACPFLVVLQSSTYHAAPDRDPPVVDVGGEAHL
jgi:hypothetical protein